MKSAIKSSCRERSAFESLERRALFSATAGIVDGTGVLEITGTAGDDMIFVEPDKLYPADLVRVSINVGFVGTFRTADFLNGIHITTGDGADLVVVYESVTADARIDSGIGNDTVAGGGGDDVIVGGAGNDILAGLAGNDSIDGGDGVDDIDGGEGNDLLSGGLGLDVIYGRGGFDTFTGDTLIEILDREAGEPDGQDTGGGGGGEEPTNPEEPCKHGADHPGKGNHYGHLKCRD